MSLDVDITLPTSLYGSVGQQQGLQDGRLTPRPHTVHSLLSHTSNAIDSATLISQTRIPATVTPAINAPPTRPERPHSSCHGLQPEVLLRPDLVRIPRTQQRRPRRAGEGFGNRSQIRTGTTLLFGWILVALRSYCLHVHHYFNFRSQTSCYS